MIGGRRVTKDIQKYIDQAIADTVTRLKMEGFLKTDTQTAYEKTEELLRRYPALKDSDRPTAQRICAEVEACLQSVSNDPYARVIELFYFEGMTNAACALELKCEERTARRNRKKLVEDFSVRLASDEFIREILGGF